jgi:Holliday junction resolvase RusA-like endonuclease
MAKYSFTLSIAPIPKGRPRLARGRAFTPERTRHFEESLRWYLRAAYRWSPLAGPILLSATFRLQRPKSNKDKYPSGHVGDLDNFLKALKDAGNGILWVDDCQVVKYGDVEKVYAPIASITVTFEELE